ncbi:hypothetical protein [Formosa sp. PL04]|uniref:hypothetical protein n=1 Tax=Formosa sp. PL04 TaxID=3081755 RepID=UPI002981476C|nr:hypothetical protein [Formosa sp. PL04]MDW5289453.1 hypothetical protein [Formosa sp. PL04]
MVTIKDFKTIKKENGEVFHALIVQGGVESVKSQKTGRLYFTVRTATVPTTFDEAVCKSILGTQFDGQIKKVMCDPYTYVVESTGELIELKHRWEFVDESLEVLQDHVIQQSDSIN